MIVLMPNCAFLSETSRALALASALRAAGEKVAIASHGGPYARLLDEAGEPWTALEPQLTPDDARAFVQAVVELGKSERPLHPPEWARVAVAAEVAYLREVGARLVVIGFSLTAYVSTAVVGIPLATVHGGSFVPAAMEARLCPAPVNPPQPGAERMPTWLGRWLANVVPPRVKFGVGWLNALAAEHGVEPVPSLAALMCGDLTLVTDLPEVLGISPAALEAWRPGWFGGYRRSTRLVYGGPIFARLELPVPERVEAFLSAPGPVVYLSPTSVTEAQLRDLIAATRAAGARVLVTATIHDVGALESPEVMVERVLPNHLVLPRVAVVVSMGGQGSVSAAMAAGTPIVGFPFHGEQELNLALAERRGMAVRLPLTELGGARLTHEVRRLLDDPAVRAAAAATRALYEGVDGPARTAEAIRRFLAAR